MQVFAVQQTRLAGEQHTVVRQLEGPVQAGGDGWWYALPVLPGVLAAQQRTAKTHGQHLAVAQLHQVVQRGRGQRLWRLPLAGGLPIQLSAFAGDQQVTVTQAEQRVQVQAVGVVQVWDIVPGAATIAGVQYCAVGADHPAFAGAAKPNIEQWA
ncbi:hypothetical protein D3C76_1407220 [compost metagenome]